MARKPGDNPLPGTLWLAAAVLLVVGGIGVGLLWYLSYGTTGAVPADVQVEGLVIPAEVAWYEDSAPVIHAEDERTYLTALGFLHGQHHAWSTALWRQTALGRLSEWLDEEVLQLDTQARMLGFARGARMTFEALTAEEQALLEAYTEGLNAAFALRSVRASDEFALLRIEPQDWEPWHPLAIERLMAWLSSPPLSLGDAPGVLQQLPERPAIAHDSLRQSSLYTTPPEELSAFLERDQQLREWLQLYGLEHSLAWARPDSLGLQLYHRISYGASAIPLLQDVVWKRDRASDLAMTTIPGTVMTPAGRGNTHAWGILPRSTVHFTWIRAEDAGNARVHTERIRIQSGDEHLVTPRTPESDLVLLDLASAPAARDSLLALEWRGFAPGTDLSAWRSLQHGAAFSFTILDGHGLFAEVGHSPQTLGTPQVHRESGEGLFVGNGPWTPILARQWEQRPENDGAGTPQGLEWWDNTFSLWAQETNTALVSVMETQPFPSEPVTMALTYLRNWNHRYERSSIGATIFDRWAARYQETYGTLPTAEAIDDAWTEREHYYRLLRETVENLTEEHGGDPSLWRWEDVAFQQRLFPAWGSPLVTGMPGRSNHPPQPLPGRGHPASPVWGPSALHASPPLTAQWEGWMRLGNGSATFTSRQHQRRPQAFRARILGSDPLPEPITIHETSSPIQTTTLRPAEHP